MLRLTRSIVPLLLSLVAACRSGKVPPVEQLRLGFFPNLTHAAAMVGTERGSFARAIAPAGLQVKVFSSGPEAVEALFAGALDACYLGPMPALNGYLRSQGQAMLIVAGAASGGAAFVVRKDAGIDGPADLHGRRLASPQLGNSQDLALRMYLADHGLKPKDRGGDVQVMPLSNPDILQLMRSGRLDGAWIPEPWVTRLVSEAGGRILVDERSRWPGGRFPSAVLAVSRRLISERPDLVRRLVAAHQESVAWIRAHPTEAQRLVTAAIRRAGKQPLPPPLLAEAWGHLEITADPQPGALARIAADARRLGYLPLTGDPTKAFDGRYLDAAHGDGGAP